MPLPKFMRPEDEVALKVFQDKVRSYARNLYLFIFFVLIVWSLCTGFYTVPEGSVAEVKRFGATRTVPPGRHFKLPFGAETVTIVPKPGQ